MFSSLPQQKPLPFAGPIAVLLVAALSTATSAAGQELGVIRQGHTPLVLRSRGSLFVGGESVGQSATELSTIIDHPPESGGHITVNQMYVE
jgi:hypothetical protein